jgi:hypothetical protein
VELLLCQQEEVEKVRDHLTTLPHMVAVTMRNRIDELLPAVANDALSPSPVPPVPMGTRVDKEGWGFIFFINVLLVVLLLSGLLFTFFTKGGAREVGTVLSFSLFGFVTLLYLCTMGDELKKVGGELSAPMIRGEANLRAYVEDMQRAELRVNIDVECHHMSSTTGKGNPNNRSKGKPTKRVTHRSSHPFEYATTCTDKSTLLKNWQVEEGTLETDFVAVLSTNLKWSAAKGPTADALNAESKRVYQEHKDRDKVCTVRRTASLPGRLKTQLYTPGDASIRRLPQVVELILVLLCLGAPLAIYYRRTLNRRILHTVHKTIYIPGHAPPG